ANIIKEIDSRPPFQQEEAGQHYLGLNVKWKVTFHSARKVSDTVTFLMLLDRGSYPWIYCDVFISDYPAIKTAQQGSKLFVTAAIARIEGNTITLTNVKMSS